MDAETMVDTGEELYLLKENIKPLKKGRMVCQLGTALLAQDDVAAHHELLKQREKYEVLLRSYEGSDPLEPWYEYILWVEQSFLRDSREGNLYVLLERCLARFKEDEGYLQDRRYIELWIKYIEMSVNPLEVYKKCHAHCIGKYCAFFYMSWAFEFEKAGDIKRADQVFSEGFKNNSQPIDELEEAHKNFQLRVARQVLSGSSEVEAACMEQRVALSKLKAHGHKKNMVGNVRVGPSVQHGFAGILQPIPQHGCNSSNVQTNPIEVSSDKEDDTGAEFSVLPRVLLPSIPRREVLNKENILKPGPWTGKPHKKNKAAVLLSRPQQPSFELHRDDDVQVQNSPLVICSALKPRKLDDEFKCSIALFEPKDPSKRPMYCRSKVYAGGTELSFEELRAIEYLKGNRPARCKQVHREHEVQLENSPLVVCSSLKSRKLDDDEFKCAIALFEPEDPSKRPMYCKSKVYAGGTELSFEELRAIEYLKGNRPARCKQVYREHEVQLENSPLMVCSSLKSRKLDDDESKCAIPLFEPEDPSKRPMYCKSKVCADGTELSFGELHAIEHLTGNRPARCKQGRLGTNGELTAAKLYGEELHKIEVFEAVECEKRNTSLSLVQAPEKQNFNLCVDVEDEEDDGFGAVPHGDTKNMAPEVLLGKIRRVDEMVGKTAASSEVLPKSDTEPPHTTDSSSYSAKMSNKSYDLSFCHQSLTYNTKEAMNMMHELWTTPEDKKLQFNMHHVGGSGSKTKTFPFEDVDTQSLQAEQPRLDFEIFKDVSAVHEQRENVAVCAPQPERKVDHYKISRDYVEGMGQVQKGSGSVLDPAQHFLVFRDSSQTLSSVKRDKKVSEPIEASNENCPFTYFREDNIAPDSATVELQCPQICTCKCKDADNHRVPCNHIKITVDAPVSHGSIPLVPSPGMTEEEEKNLSGTEMKENLSPESDLVSQIEKRYIAGILQPSTDIPCDPQEDPALKGEFLEPEAYYSNITCNTEVFTCPLLSSTPLVGQLKQPSDKNTAKSSAETWYCHSDEVSAHRSAGSTAHKVPNLSTTVVTVEPYKSSSSSGSSGSMTHHTAMSFQQNCTAGNMKRNENIHKSNRNSGNDRGITTAWQEYCSVQEVCGQSEHNSSDHLIVKMTAESFHYKMETVHLPEGPNPSHNVWMEESVNSVLQEEPDSHDKQAGIPGCQQIRGRNFRSLKNSTGLKPKSKDDKALLKSGDENVIHAQADALGHVGENECGIDAYRASSSRTQENCLAGDFSELKLEGPRVIDPFDLTLIQKLLTHVGFPSAEHSKCCVKVNVQMPRFKIGGNVTLGRDKFTIEKILGEGSYAKVFKAVDIGTQKTVALKIQKPSWEWEFYICHQLQSRLSDPLSAMAFMDVHKAYILNNGSIMVTDYSKYGSLLSVLVKLRQHWVPVPEDLLLYWMIELLSIAEKLQQCRIIHGDIKPDNFVLRTLPSLQSKEPSLQLIDMGRAIDMTLFPEGTTFNTVVTTKDFQCIEMQTKQPWTYQIDLYGIAGTMHCVYFSQYMKVFKESDGRWFIRQSFSRYSKRHLWEQFFYTLLNVESCEKLPDLPELRRLVEAEILSNKHFSDLTHVRNILGGK